MANRSNISYYGFRIYFISNLLYFFLVIPFILFILGQSIPDLMEEKGYLGRNNPLFDSTLVDSLRQTLDSADMASPDELESMIQETAGISITLVDSLVQDREDQSIALSPMGITIKEDGEVVEEEEGGPFRRFFNLLLLLSLVSWAVGLAYNLPFKRYFKKYRRQEEIPDKLHRYCKKQLSRTPLINALIIFLPGAIALLYSIIFYLSGMKGDIGIENEKFRDFFLLGALATLLEFLFAFFWQRHRVHIRYIHHIFSSKELQTNIFSGKSKKIRNRLVLATTMTTFLPLLIVLAYMVESITTVQSLDLNQLDKQAWNILFGPWGEMIDNGKDLFDLENLKWMLYVNAIDTLSMIIGISTGILASLVYLLLFIRWTNRDITYPLKEMLHHIRNTRAGQTEQYTAVRTNDEFGELAEGYNEMTRKIHEHVERISEMNRNLEEKVKERTREVVMQKEEIEAQKEEIEAQLDLATEQRDTIGQQNEQILDSIRYAQQIQHAILPPTALLKETFSDHFILFKPRDIVSGDFYWVNEKNGLILLAVADCTGHGVPGAFLSVLGISSLNEIVGRSEKPSAAGILEELREYLIRSLHQTGGPDGSQDGIEIALCVFDPKKRSVEFAGANRPLYLIRKGKVIQYRGDRMPIGIYEQEELPFNKQVIKLETGDSLYLFSDGYADQMGGSKRKTYRVSKLRKLLLEIQDKDMAAQEKILQEKHLEWRGKDEQIDDILVAGIRL